MKTKKITTEYLNKLRKEYQVFKDWGFEQPRKQTALMILGLRR